MKVKKGLYLFLLVASCVSIGTIALTVDRSSIDLLLRADRWKLTLAASLVPLIWLFDALRFSAIARASGHRIPLRLSLTLIWINYFGCAITPMQSGGGPFQIYLLYRNGIPVGKGVAVTLVRTMMTLLILGMAIPLAMIFSPNILQGQRLIRDLAIYITSVMCAIWAVVAISLLRPSLVKRTSAVITMLLKRLGLIGPNRLRRIIRHVNAEVDIYNENMRSFWQNGKGHILLGAIFTFLQQMAQLSVLPCLIWAMGLPVEYFKSVLLQALLLFALYFIPTPGGSGAAEGGGAAAFRLLVPTNVAGMLAVGWRGLVEYSGVLIGTLLAIKIFGLDRAEELITKTEEEIDSSAPEV